MRHRRTLATPTLRYLTRLQTPKGRRTASPSGWIRFTGRPVRCRTVDPWKGRMTRKRRPRMIANTNERSTPYCWIPLAKQMERSPPTRNLASPKRAWRRWNNWRYPKTRPRSCRRFRLTLKTPIARQLPSTRSGAEIARALRRGVSMERSRLYRPRNLECGVGTRARKHRVTCRRASRALEVTSLNK